MSKEGVSTDPEKTQVVQQWEPPTTKNRHFIPAFAKIAAPLHALLAGMLSKKDLAIVWSPQCQAAFEKLKATLLSVPIMAYADSSEPFNLYTDASLEGPGAAGGGERVAAYASCSLYPAKKNDQNHSSFKLELLALKWAVTEKFRLLVGSIIHGLH